MEKETYQFKTDIERWKVKENDRIRKNQIPYYFIKIRLINN